MEKGGGKKWLVAILVFLVVVIVGLVTSVVVVNLNRKTEDVVDEISHEELTKGEYDTNYNISSNISEIYYTDSKEKALELFDREAKMALSEEYYNRYVYLILDESNLLINDGRCEDALGLYNAVDYGILPIEQRADIYTSAIAGAKICKNDERKTYYEDKLDKLIEEEDLGVEDGIDE